MLKRVRYQIGLGLLIGVGLPVLFRTLAFELPVYVTTQMATIVGGAIAIVLGYIGYRRMMLFPGISSGAYVITSLTITYGTLVALMFILRLDYSRLQLFGSYVLSVATLLYIHFAAERSRELCFAYLPGGLSDTLPSVREVRWCRIDRPDQDLNGIDAVVVDLHHDHEDRWESAIAGWVLAGIPVYDARPAREQLTGKVEINHLYENTLGSLNPNNILLKAKSVADFFAALILIVAFAPILLALCIVIRLDSPGPAIFKQKRTGFRARPFTVYKFRTMFVAKPETDASAMRQSAMTADGDKRITRFGRLLRRSRLDELPQLFNVLKGEMSMIGPRPEAIALSEWYERQIPFYHYRHIIKPGLTGWAQVNQGHVTDVDAVREKLNLDFYYVKNYSAWLDFLIVLRTIAIMATGSGAR